MASCNFRKAAAGANVRQMLCCLMMAITLMKGACAATVLYNKSGRDLVLINPQHHLNIEVPAGQSVKLEGVQQQRGVVIKDMESGAMAGPLNLPDNLSLDAVCTRTAATTSALHGDAYFKIPLGGTSLMGQVHINA